MGTRDCVTLPEVKECGIDCSSSYESSSSTSKCEETDVESDKYLNALKNKGKHKAGAKNTVVKKKSKYDEIEIKSKRSRRLMSDTMNS